MNWEDLRYILAVSRHGTMLAAARALGVSPTTMSRRLRSLEEEQGAELFEKVKHGVVLSGAGERTVAVAEAVERLTNELDAEIHGLDARLAGTLRVTSTELLSKHFFADFTAFNDKYPDIELCVTSSTSITNLSQREADVAIRIGPSAPDHLVGSKYATMWYAAYATPELVERIGPKAPNEAFPWFAWDRQVYGAIDEWFANHAPGAKIVLRVSEMSMMVHAARSGHGVAVLPCVVGDRDPCLVRVGTYLEDSPIHVWLLTHPRLRGAARVRAFLAMMRDAVRRDADLFEGRCPRG